MIDIINSLLPFVKFIIVAGIVVFMSMFAIVVCAMHKAGRFIKQVDKEFDDDFFKTK